MMLRAEHPMSIARVRYAERIRAPERCPRPGRGRGDALRMTAAPTERRFSFVRHIPHGPAGA